VQRFLGGRNVLSDVDVSEVLELNWGGDDVLELHVILAVVVVERGVCVLGLLVVVEGLSTDTIMADNINIRGTECEDQVVKSLDDNPGSRRSLTPSCGGGTSTAGSVGVRLAATDGGVAAAMGVAVAAGGVGGRSMRTGEGLRGIERGDAGRMDSFPKLVSVPSRASNSLFFLVRAAFSSWRLVLLSWSLRFSSASKRRSDFIFSSISSISSIYCFFLSLAV